MLWTAKDEELPVVGTIASQFNDAGINDLFGRLIAVIEKKTGVRFSGQPVTELSKTSMAPSRDLPPSRVIPPSQVIPPSRVRYLSEITAAIREYDGRTEEQAAIASALYQIDGVLRQLPADFAGRPPLEEQKRKLEQQLFPVCKKLVDEWPATKALYQQEIFRLSDEREKLIR